MPTTRVGEIWHLGPVYKNSPINPGASGFDEWFSAPNFFVNNTILSSKGIAVKTRGESSIVMVDAAIYFLRKTEDPRIIGPNPDIFENYQRFYPVRPFPKTDWVCK